MDSCQYAEGGEEGLHFPRFFPERYSGGQETTSANRFRKRRMQVTAGFTDSRGAADHDVYLIKTDSRGNIQWR